VPGRSRSCGAPAGPCCRGFSVAYASFSCTKCKLGELMQ
jgi:hypothetical protein